jgi:hypothetical protein
MAVQDVPNLINVIEQTRRDYPTAWKNCHRAELGQALSEEFARRAAYACSLVDPRFGLNGKRGDPNDLSDDCVCFLHDDGRESVIDFGGGAGGDNPTVQWSIVGHYQVPGAPRQLWIKAAPVGGSSGGNGGGGTAPPPPAPKPFPPIAMPWDVQVTILTRVHEGVWPRDRVPEITETGLVGTGTLTRGALAFAIPVQIATIAAWVSANSNRAPAGLEWWPLADKIVADTLAAYRKDQPTP